MASSLSYLPLQDSEVPANASSLIDTWAKTAAWIWTKEENTGSLAPRNSQRAFRRTWTNTAPSLRSISSTTIMISADNYFELFVNGILLHQIQSDDYWRRPLLFTAAVIGDSITYAVRAVNADDAFQGPTPAGLRAAIRIDFASSSASYPPEMFYTAASQNWTSSHLFGYRWEQPEFDDSRWDVVEEMPNPTTFNETAVTWEPARLQYALQVPTGGVACPPLPIPTSPGVGSAPPSPMDPSEVGFGMTWASSTLMLARGQFAGIIAGVAVGAALLGALVSFLLVRRRYTQGKVF
ncbi:hypothetical protein NMY22_g3189 [Coprinellus aureogranulatus]|nr:hypothetical protein NMY22_g3189 [Coprinellus aureogranulatus]